MSRQVLTTTITPVLIVDGLALSQSVTNDFYNLDGSIGTDEFPLHQITFTNTTGTGTTIIKGLNQAGGIIEESVDNAVGVVVSKGIYKQIISLEVVGDVTGSTVGLTGLASSPWMIMNSTGDNFTPGVFTVVPDTTVVTYSLVHTPENINLSKGQAAFQEYPHSFLADQTASADGSYSNKAYALRMKVTDYTSGPLPLTLTYVF